MYFKLFTILLFISIPILSQEKSFNSKTSEVIVTANKIPTSAIEVASSYSIITSKDLERLQKTNALEILRSVEGISITQQGGPGKISSIFTRGANSNHTLVLIDGIEMNDPSSTNNAYDLANLLVTNIERIEIVRGPQSTLYGSEAMAGVINIITKSGSEKPQFSLFSEAGSNSHFKGSLSANGSYSLINYAASFSRLQTDGISAISEKYGATEDDSYENVSASLKIGLNFLSNLSVDANYRYTFSEAGIDQSSPDGDDPNYIYDVEENVFGLNANFALYNDKWQGKIYSGITRRISHAIDKVDQIRTNESSNNYADATRLKYGFQNILTFIPNNKIIVGIETESEEATTSFRSNGQFGPFESMFPKQSVSTNSFYFQNQVTPFNNFFTNVGVRFDEHQKFGSHVTYRIAPAYFISSTNTKLKATYGTGYKAPSLFYLFDPAFGNPDLNAEESKGWDVGIEQYLLNNEFRIGLTYFNTEFDELIGFDENFVTVNIDKAETSGFELSTIFDNGEDLIVSANATYTKALDKSPGVIKENEELIRRPEYKANLNVNYSPISKLNLNLGIRYVGERVDLDFSQFPSNRVNLESYIIGDLAASYKLLDFLTIKARVENLLDEEYEEILFYGTLRRSFYFGAGLEL
jgi:vitamin B12 transporter